MLKKLVFGAGMLACVTVMAADVAPTTPVQAQDKKSQGLVCQQQATAKNLEGAAKKQSMVQCLKAAAAAAPAK
ncbi:MAG: PsiF family protein [Comamonadaceae bacterium]